MELLLLVIPFEDTGAMETFLLNAIANDSAYDAEIIRKGNQFVEEVDKERRYLTKRRYITKSKFDVYFSIRTAAEQFVERQNILKRVLWEQYSQIQEEFQKLKDFGIPGTIGQEEERELPVQWKAGDLEELKKEHIIRPQKSQKVTGCFW